MSQNTSTLFQYSPQKIDENHYCVFVGVDPNKKYVQRFDFKYESDKYLSYQFPEPFDHDEKKAKAYLDRVLELNLTFEYPIERNIIPENRVCILKLQINNTQYYFMLTFKYICDQELIVQPTTPATPAAPMTIEQKYEVLKKELREAQDKITLLRRELRGMEPIQLCKITYPKQDWSSRDGSNFDDLMRANEKYARYISSAVRLDDTRVMKYDGKYDYHLHRSKEYKLPRGDRVPIRLAYNIANFKHGYTGSLFIGQFGTLNFPQNYGMCHLIVKHAKEKIKNVGSLTYYEDYICKYQKLDDDCVIPESALLFMGATVFGYIMENIEKLMHGTVIINLIKKGTDLTAIISLGKPGPFKLYLKGKNKFFSLSTRLNYDINGFAHNSATNDDKELFN